MEVTLAAILQIAQIIVIGAGGVGFLFSIKSELVAINTTQSNSIREMKEIQVDLNKKIERIDKELEQLTEVTVKLARQDERMTSQDLRIATLQAQLLDHLKTEKTRSGRSKG